MTAAASRWISGEGVTCRTPVFAQGRVPVEVTLNGHDFTADATMYEFKPATHVLSISPQSGPVTGGTTVKIRASNVVFSGHLKCRFGSHDVPASFVSATELACVSPAHVEGDVKLQVSKNGVDFETSEDRRSRPS